MARISGRRVFPSMKSRIFMSVLFHTKRDSQRCSLQTVFLAFFEKSLAADAERFRGAADLIVRGLKRGGDDFAFDLFERAQAGEGANRTGSRSANTFRKICR